MPEELRFHPRDGSPWALGEALAEVGPGWWPLLRRAFAAVDAEPGAWVRHVAQKFGALRLSIGHADWELARATFAALVAELEEESRRRCEACGELVERPMRRGECRWRNHCDRCQARLEVLSQSASMGAERRLWMEHAGRWLPEWGCVDLDDPDNVGWR